jgi:hypothetical protein
MSYYVIYHKETTIQHRHPRTEKRWWQLKTSAVRELNRAGLNPDIWIVEKLDTFHHQIEKTFTIKEIATGVEEETPMNTPDNCLDGWERV